MAIEAGAPPRVLVGVDGSAESIGALKWAADYARATGANITAVLCWHNPAPVGPAPVSVGPAVVSGEVRARMQETLAKSLADVFGTATPDKVQTKVAYGHPASVLVEESEKADLLVVGHRGHGAFAGMMLGSVSMHCVTNAACPVVVVRGGLMSTATQAIPLSDPDTAILDRYWRAANYLGVGQIYLMSNPLLRQPLQPEQVKPRLLGHWGKTPGLNFIWAHLNRAIVVHDAEMMVVVGPGHGGPAALANSWLEGSYTDAYPSVPQDDRGRVSVLSQRDLDGPDRTGASHLLRKCSGDG